MGKIEYDSNNSGGRWWLSDENWRALEAAGWTVEWAASHPYKKAWLDSDKLRYLGALATSAFKENVASMRDGVAEWERLTGCTSTAAGCPCCGQPHNFTFTNDDGSHEYGPETFYEARW